MGTASRSRLREAAAAPLVRPKANRISCPGRPVVHLLPRGLHRQADRHGRRHEGDHRRRSAAGRLRLRPRLPGRAVRARGQGHPDLRGARRVPASPGQELDWDHRRGLACTEVLEHLPTDHLRPKTATTVLGGKSVTLDLDRESLVFSEAQRLATAVSTGAAPPTAANALRLVPAPPLHPPGPAAAAPTSTTPPKLTAGCPTAASASPDAREQERAAATVSRGPRLRTRVQSRCHASRVMWAGGTAGGWHDSLPLRRGSCMARPAPILC
jgi:hypothetical protein